MEEKNNKRKKITHRVADLINVKSIITIALTLGFLYLTFNSIVGSDQYINIYLMIITFYFSAQSISNKDK